MGIVAATSYDGNNINDGTTFRAYLVADENDLPPGEGIKADVDFGYPYLVGQQKLPRQFTLRIQMRDATTDALKETRYNQLKQWFSTERGGARYLVATWTNAPTSRRIACIPKSVTFQDKVCTVVLEAPVPVWENNSLKTTDWYLSSSGATTTVVNAGNRYVAPTVRYRVAAAQTGNAWTYRKRVLVRNQLTRKLTAYPLDLTDGGWNTSALLGVTTAAGTASGGTTATAGTITVTTNAGLAASGAAYITNSGEQFYYAAKGGTTTLTGCQRGINGSTAGTIGTGYVIRQSAIAWDGRDIRVEWDGQEIPRWFGGTATAAKGPGGTATTVWAVVPEIPALNSDWSDGWAVENGTNLALRKTVTASNTMTGYNVGSLTDGTPLGGATGGWRTNNGVTAAYAVVDLGASMPVNRVRLRLHPDANYAPEDYTIEYSTDGATYGTAVTVASATAYNRWVTHDFQQDQTARYMKVNITDNIGPASGYIHLMQIEVYCARPRLEIKYGNPTAGVPNQPPDTDATSTKPMLTLSTSTNTLWDYDQFYDSTAPLRAASWVRTDYLGVAGGERTRKRAYPSSQDSGTAWPAEVVGIASWRAGEVSGRNGFTLGDYAQIGTVVHSGYTKQNPSYTRWKLAAFDELGAGRTVMEQTANTSGTFTAFAGTIAATLPSGTRKLVYFQHTLAGTTTQYYGEVTDVTLTLGSTPVVTSSDVLNTQSVDTVIQNDTLGQKLYVKGLLALATDIDIDCYARTCTEVLSGVSRIGMVSMEAGTVRDAWLQLGPGTTTFSYTDAGVGSAVLQFRYRDQWL